MKTMNEVIFEKLVNEYNRRVSAGMSRDYRQRAWKVVLTAYKENQYEPWMRKFTIREMDKIIYKVGRGRPNYTKQYIDWKVKEVLGSACYLLHIFLWKLASSTQARLAQASNPKRDFSRKSANTKS